MSKLEPIEIITDPKLFGQYVDTLMIARKGKQIGATKPTGFYLWDGKIYGVSIAFADVQIFEYDAFMRAAKAGEIPGYIPFDWIDRLPA